MLTEAEATLLADETRKELRVLDISSVDVTCERCQENDKCEYAFDLYNTDGDCLAEK